MAFALLFGENNEFGEGDFEEPVTETKSSNNTLTVPAMLRREISLSKNTTSQLDQRMSELKKEEIDATEACTRQVAKLQAEIDREKLKLSETMARIEKEKLAISIALAKSKAARDIAAYARAACCLLIGFPLLQKIWHPRCQRRGVGVWSLPGKAARCAHCSLRVHTHTHLPLCAC